MFIKCFSVDEKSSKDLRQYLSSLAEQSESNGTTELPAAIILDNLHLASSLTDVLNSVVGLKSEKYRPYIIGTLNQPNCSSDNLQLHHNFRLAFRKISISLENRWRFVGNSVFIV